jgi:putative flippase GtrA
MLRAVPTRFHAITDEMAKFGTIGLINLGVNFAVFNALLVGGGDSQVKSKAVATVVATTCAYFLNRHWTYRHRPKSTLRREYSLFFLFNAVGLVIETGIVAFAKYGFDQTSIVVLNLCTFVGIGIGTVFRFWAYRTHVFKESASGAEAEAATVAEAAQPVMVHSAVPVPTVELRDEQLRAELVQLELDEMLTRDGMVSDGTDQTPRH